MAAWMRHTGSAATDYYVKEGRFPKLRIVDEPVGTGYYVLLTRPGDDELREKLNAAIRKAIRTGYLRDLYKKYGLWNAGQQQLVSRGAALARRRR